MVRDLAGALWTHRNRRLTARPPRKVPRTEVPSDRRNAAIPYPPHCRRMVDLHAGPPDSAPGLQHDDVSSVRRLEHLGDAPVEGDEHDAVQRTQVHEVEIGRLPGSG